MLVRGGGETALSIVGGELSGFAGDTRLRLEPRPEGFVLHQPGQRAFRYVRVEGYPGDDAQPALADLVELAGVYRCRELDVSYEVRLDPRPGLTLVGVNGERPLEPVFEDPDGPSPVYAWDRGTVRFLPDPGDDPRPGVRAFGGAGPGIPVRPAVSGPLAAGSMIGTISRRSGIPPQRCGIAY